MNKNYYSSLEIKYPSEKFINELQTNRFIIIKGKEKTGKTTFSKSLHKFLENCIVFSFEKNISARHWFQIKRDVQKNTIFSQYNSDQICNFISNDSLIKILQMIYNNQSFKFIFDFDEEENLFHYLNSIYDIKELMKKYKFFYKFNLSLIDIDESNLINFQLNCIKIHIFQLFSDWKLFKQTHSYNKKDLYAILQERDIKHYYLKQNDKTDDTILDNLILMNYISDFNIIDNIVYFLNKKR